MEFEFDELLEHALALCEDGEYQQASGVLRHVLRSAPADVRAWELLARCELAARNYEACLDAARRTSELSPRSSVARRIACLALLKLGRVPEAVQEGREATRVDASDWRALDTLARVLTATGSGPSEPRELVGRLLALAPDEPEAHVTAGVIAAAEGDRDQARRAFLNALKLDPSSAAAHHGLARLRLRRRMNDPAALADAAAGFSRALRADARYGRSRRHLDLVLRVFLSRMAYLLLIDAFIVGRVVDTSSSVASRLIPLVALLVPGFYALRFAARSTPETRRWLRETVNSNRPLRLATAIETVAVAAIITAAAVPASTRSACTILAALCALAGRLVIYSQLEHAARAVRNQPQSPAISSGLLWVIAVALLLCASALVLVFAQGKAAAGALVGAAVCAGGAAALICTARRRRRESA